MPISRRALLSAAVTAPILNTPTLLSAQKPAAPSKAAPRQRFAVSTYSFWHFKTEKYPIEKVIEDAHTMGFDGVELLHRQFASEDTVYLNKLKQMAFARGLSLPMLSIHQDFVSPDAAERKKNIDHTKHCLDLAAQLGIPAIRLNSGRWKTIKSFDDLMKAKGEEPPLPGYKESDAFGWCVDSIRECLPHCEKLGIRMNLENHWGLTTRTENLLRIWKDVNSPWLGINLDTGNYPGDPYPEIERLAPHAAIVQAKTYFGGGVWYTLDLDYKRIANTLKKANFTGWVSLEMEGNEDAATAVPKSLKQLQAAFA